MMPSDFPNQRCHMCEMNAYCPTCMPTEAIKAYESGRIHVVPPTGDGNQWRVMQRNRVRAFALAAARGEPNLDRWPEFRGALQRLGLQWYWEQRPASMPAWFFITGHGKSAIDWIRRGERLRRRGIDPTTRPKYIEATERLQALLATPEIAGQPVKLAA